MDRRILRLGRALRDAGAPVSGPEILDAARAALAVGVDRRADLRTALRAALIKREEFLAGFDGLFERLFPAGLPRPPKRARGGGARPGEGAAGRGEAADGGGGQARGRDARRPAAAKAPTPAPEGEAETPGEHGELGDRGGIPAAQPACEAGPEGDGSREGPASRRRVDAAHRAETAAQRLLAKGFRERWNAEEERQALEAMEALARRLATRLARRRVRARRGALDLPGTLRANLVHGGIPFVVRHRARVQGRRDLVLLADVSGSVRRAASLFLLILGRLRGRFAGVRAFAYVDRPAEIPAALAARPPGAIAAALAAELPLEALSDHGEAFRRFNRDFPAAVGRRSVVVILGDARSNRFPAQAWEVEAIRRRCRRLVWVVPEPESLWGSGDSAIAAYAPFCHAVIAAPNAEALAGAAGRITALS